MAYYLVSVERPGAGGLSSNRHFMRGGIPHRQPPLVVDLGGGDVLVIEQFLDGFNRHAGVQQLCPRRAYSFFFVRRLISAKASLNSVILR